MRIGENGIELRGWQVTLLFVVILAGIGATTFVAINSQKVQVKAIEASQEKAKIEQQQKSERGHWLWGHWDDIAEKKGPKQ